MGLGIDVIVENGLSFNMGKEDYEFFNIIFMRDLFALFKYVVVSDYAMVCIGFSTSKKVILERKRCPFRKCTPLDS